ncbi:19830_t:CDS:2, partial [Racocetra fulgida]
QFTQEYIDNAIIRGQAPGSPDVCSTNLLYQIPKNGRIPSTHSFDNELTVHSFDNESATPPFDNEPSTPPSDNEPSTPPFDNNSRLFYGVDNNPHLFYGVSQEELKLISNSFNEDKISDVLDTLTSTSLLPCASQNIPGHLCHEGYLCFKFSTSRILAEFDLYLSHQIKLD